MKTKINVLTSPLRKTLLLLYEYGSTARLPVVTAETIDACEQLSDLDLALPSSLGTYCLSIEGKRKAYELSSQIK